MDAVAASDLREAVAHVVNYSWASEERDYFEQLPEDREGHVFEDLRVMQAWLASVSAA